MINPGDLNKGHRNLDNDCFSCHVPLKGISNEKCIKCHAISEIGIKNLKKNSNIKILFHQSLTDQNCSACHTDHNESNRTNKVNVFSHDLVNKTIIAECLNCHTTPSDNKHDKFSPDCSGCHSTFKWNDKKNFNHKNILENDLNRCIACHKAPEDELHIGILDNCSTCHGYTKWKPSTFDHSSKFVLDNDHNTRCNTCHLNNNYKSYTCYGCHEHSPGKIADEHNEEGISNFDNCVSCHKSGSEHDFKREGNRENKRNKESDENTKDDDD